VLRDHVSRDLDARLDLSFVRDWVTGCCLDRGLPSIDPVVFFERSLVMVFTGTRSERQRLAQRVCQSLGDPVRLLLGYIRYGTGEECVGLLQLLPQQLRGVHCSVRSPLS
jgi:hypothetical protein